MKCKSRRRRRRRRSRRRNKGGWWRRRVYSKQKGLMRLSESESLKEMIQSL
jgi:hypothetical protein